jgi:hypothetical protein
MGKNGWQLIIKNINMKQLLSLFLFLLPCLAWAQYPSNGNQKITLGEQTSADGLIWRGVANDTNVITPFSDTSAYIILDTVNKKLYFYKVSAIPKWNEISGSGGSTLDTATMLLPYYRSGRTGIIQALDVPTLNQNTTGSAATLTTSRTFQTNLASTSTASFNGSANVTPGVTGTLAVANGGTNATTLTANKVMVGNGTSGVLTPTNLHWDNSNSRLGIGIASPSHILSLSATASNGTVIGLYNTFNDDRNRNWGIATNQSEFADFHIRQSNAKDGNPISAGTSRLTISSTGAATFSSSVTATDLRLTNLTNVTDLRTDAEGDLYNGGSDVNLKNNIEPINYGLNEVLKIKPVQFYWNKEKYNYSGYKTIGFIAQDLMDIIPNAATVSGDGYMQIEYTAIIATLTKAIQEQQALIKALEQRIINLENK